MSLSVQLTNISKKLLPLLLNEAVNWTLNNYKKQQWEGTAWPARKRENRLSRGKPLLVSRRDMYNAIRVIDDHSFGVVGIPYARTHNEGGTITQAPRSSTRVQNRFKKGIKKGRFKRGSTAGRGFTYKQRVIRIPARKFIGNTAALRKHLTEKGQQFLNQ